MNDTDEQIARKWAENVRRARRSFLPFTVFTFPDLYRVHWHHRYKAAALELWQDPSFDLITRLALSEPPRHGKTELASRRLPAWIFGRDPTSNIIATSRDADFARRVSRQVKRIINSPKYRLVFPETSIPTKHVASDERESWKNTAKHWQIVGHGGEYEAFGAGQGIAGVGAEYLLVEDPYPNREKAQSKSYREGINTWFEDDLRERRQDNARILVIHTRWHQNDLIGHVTRTAREVEQRENWVWLNFPGIRMEGGGVQIHFAGQSPDERRAILRALEVKGVPVDYEDETIVDPRDAGGALWPHRRSAGELIAVRETQPRAFWSLIQGEPTPPGGSIFERSWIERWEQLPTTEGRWVWACDPKHGSSEPDSSEAVVQLWFQPRTEPANAYLVDEHRGIWSEPETEDEFLRLGEHPLWSRASTKLVEAEGDGRAIVANLSGEIPGLTLCLTPSGPTSFKSTDSKEQRGRAVARFFQSGNVKLPPDKVHPEVDSLIEQFARFPGAERDDRVDAAVYAVDYLLRDHDDEDDEDIYEGLFDE